MLNTLNRVEFSFYITSGLRLHATGYGIYIGPPDASLGPKIEVNPDAKIAWPGVCQPSFQPTARGSGKQGKEYTPPRQPQAKIDIGLRV
ncbi:unnamed protein product [Phytophthora fragariaefolia]|uniref:Unnamed protein product n=1 Tax=Phytophthora fragariaefolia TaxID=1490495 RepID=A0A9W7CVS2_9STRA|nr:unnamed protein product [Phytophthora fragariaefolia]